MLWKGKKQAATALFTSGHDIILSLPMEHLNSATYMFKRSEILAKRILNVLVTFVTSLAEKE